jgi:prepilin-type N-terminal cleavage/methylation domain-containing protein
MIQTSRGEAAGSMQRRDGGFTLLEMMVALVVAGIVVLAAHAAISLASDVAARRTSAAEPVLRGHAARRMLEGWLRSATLEGGALVAIDRRDGDQQLDEVAFTTADGGALFPGRARVRLWVNRDSRSLRTGLLAELLASGLGYEALPETVSIAPFARGVALRYRVRLDGRSAWVDAWTSDRQLPEAVELRISGPGGSLDPRDAPLLYLPLIVPLGRGEP